MARSCVGDRRVCVFVCEPNVTHVVRRDPERMIQSEILYETGFFSSGVCVCVCSEILQQIISCALAQHSSHGSGLISVVKIARAHFPPFFNAAPWARARTTISSR